ncbi:hypothetical protein LINPERHAP1_LOCUS22090 [Linum perenne]
MGDSQGGLAPTLRQIRRDP